MKGLLCAYLVLLGALAVARGRVWRDMLTLFADAAQQEPRSAFAHYGLGLAHATAWEQLRASRDPRSQLEATRELQRWASAWEAVFGCVDAERLLQLNEVAVALGRHQLQRGNIAEARHFLTLASRERRGAKDDPKVRAEALAWLALLEWDRRRDDAALGLLGQALALDPGRDELRLQRGRIHAALAGAAAAQPAARAAHLQLAREDLERVKPGSRWHEAAQAELARLPPP